MISNTVSLLLVQRVTRIIGQKIKVAILFMEIADTTIW